MDGTDNAWLCTPVDKLSTICLNTITKNFYYLMEAYEPGCGIPGSDFESLKRTASKALLKKFCMDKDAAKYVHFFLNSSMKEINLKICFWDPTIVMQQLIVISKTIEKLCLSGSKYSIGSLLALSCELPNIKLMTLHSVPLSKEVLYNIGHFCPCLETLNLFVSDITDEMIQGLCCDGENRTLQRLDISMTKVTTIGVIMILQYFPNLLFLRHPNVFDALCQTHADVFKNGNITSAKKYKLMNLEIPNGVKMHWNEQMLRTGELLCPEITDLSLACIDSQLQFDVITKLSTLTKLYIYNKEGVSLDLSYFLEAMGRNLEVLIAKRVALSADSIVEFCPKLQLLKLQSITFKPLKKAAFNYTLLCLKVLILELMNFSKDIVTKSTSRIILSTVDLMKLTISFGRKLNMEYFLQLIDKKILKGIQELNIIESIESSIDPTSALYLLSYCRNIRILNLKGSPMSSDSYYILRNIRPTIKVFQDCECSCECSAQFKDVGPWTVTEMTRENIMAQKKDSTMNFVNQPYLYCILHDDDWSISLNYHSFWFVNNDKCTCNMICDQCMDTERDTERDLEPDPEPIDFDLSEDDDDINVQMFDGIVNGEFIDLSAIENLPSSYYSPHRFLSL